MVEVACLTGCRQNTGISRPETTCCTALLVGWLLGCLLATTDVVVCTMDDPSSHMPSPLLPLTGAPNDAGEGLLKCMS